MMMTDQYPEVRLLIDGEWSQASGSGVRSVVCPFNGTELTRFNEASSDDVDRALAAAKKALAEWQAVAPIKRAEIIHRAAQILRDRVDELARLQALELGQPYEEAKSYVLRGAEVVEWDAAEGRRLYGRIIPSEPGTRVMAIREPIGVVAAFTPWNAPVFTPCRKLGSVLAAGCALVMKGAEETPASTAAVVQAFVDAGVPAGVINLLYGDPEEISSRLIASPVVRLVTFTGSARIGKHLAGKAAAVMKPSVMELGGHAPVIVCEDANIEDAAAKLAFVKFRNSGQACLCPSRFWIAEPAYDRFVEAFLGKLEKLKLGDAFDPETTMGPLAGERRLTAMESLVADAKSCGARVLAGGERVGDRGYFFAPTVLADVPKGARVLEDEPFGPIAILNRFDDLDAVIREANSLPYGLAAYVFTRSAATADKLSRQLECGTVGINHLGVSTSGVPFGGVKESGYGREGGVEGVESYTILKTVSHLFL